MSILPSKRSSLVRLLVWTLAIFLAIAGCTLPKYRRQADEDAYRVLAERTGDPRWYMPGFSVEVDPRSRYFDGYDPDRQPMPQDDPSSHEYIHCVNGMKGWKHWEDNGFRGELENPFWRQQLGDYVELTPEGDVLLTLDSALRLAYVHSPNYQVQVETLYLSALDVTTERFRLESQFFGGNLTSLTHLGRFRSGRRLAPGPLAPLADTTTLATDSDLQMRRQFATAGDLLVGFANSFVWQFAGPDTNSAFSIMNINLVQPLLRGAGRERALERLTRSERGLLGNVRQLVRYREGFYTQMAIGNLGVGQVGRLGGFLGGTGLTGFTGTGQTGLGGVGQATGFGGGFFGGGGGAEVGGGAGLAGGGAGQVGGFLGLLQSLQQIRNARYSLDLQQRTLALLEANLEAGTIDLTQVDQFRQNIATLQAQLLQATTGQQTTLDAFKTGTLGLPPDLEIALDDSAIAQFQLIKPDVTLLQDRIAAYQSDLGELPVEPEVDALRMAFEQAQGLLGAYGDQFDVTRRDLDQMEARAELRERSMTPEERAQFQRDRQALDADFAARPGVLSELQQQLDQMLDALAPNSRREILAQLVGWTRRLSDQVQAMSLIQARARLEAITLETVQLDPTMALNIAQANRLDFMNARAALVDSWRLIAFNADQLQSVLDLELRGDIETTGDNPLKFQGANGSLRGSLEFDAPIERLVERNDYRQALVDFQQSRRSLIQFDDQINQILRRRLRDLEQLRANLEIQRRAVAISIRRVDFTLSELNRPPATAAVPGQAPVALGPTAVQNLLSALSDLSNAQNNFMSVWLNYYSERMQLVRDLGIMELDDEGRWIDRPLAETLDELTAEPIHLPPPIPGQWWQLADPNHPYPGQGEPKEGQDHQPAIRQPDWDRGERLPSPAPEGHAAFRDESVIARNLPH